MKGKIEFVVGGVMKGGTTSLRYYLKQHPNLDMGISERHYFDAGESKLPLPRPDIMIGDVTPVYLYSCVEKIYEYNPEMKWILLLRDPVDRAISHYYMKKRAGEESRGLLQAMMCMEDKPQKAYIKRGLYAEQLKRLYKYFPKSRVRLYESSFFRIHKEGVLEDILDFLCVKTFKEIECDVDLTERHIGIYPEVFVDDRNRIREMLMSDLKELRFMVPFDISKWMEYE